jgi:uncharacterized protein (DUF488 family)
MSPDQHTINLYTIGSSNHSARSFFTLLKENNVKKLIDIRIINNYQLAGFAKGTDLEYYCEAILDIPYIYRPDFAPTKDLLHRARKGLTTWDEYVVEFMDLINKRNVISQVDQDYLEGAALLCAEYEPAHCHRRLLAEYFQTHIPGIEIIHLQ